jgi:hypothetical protein
MQYMYQAEKLSAARRALMLPHSRSEADSIGYAFHELSLAFHRMDESGLDDNARGWVRTLKEMMDTTGIEDEAGRGTAFVKAEGFTVDQKIELSRTVDELAHWFERRSWEQ